MSFTIFILTRYCENNKKIKEMSNRKQKTKTSVKTKQQQQQSGKYKSRNKKESSQKSCLIMNKCSVRNAQKSNIKYKFISKCSNNNKNTARFNRSKSILKRQLTSGSNTKHRSDQQRQHQQQTKKRSTMNLKERNKMIKSNKYGQRKSSSIENGFSSNISSNINTSTSKQYSKSKVNKNSVEKFDIVGKNIRNKKKKSDNKNKRTKTIMINKTIQESKVKIKHSSSNRSKPIASSTVKQQHETKNKNSKVLKQKQSIIIIDQTKVSCKKIQPLLEKNYVIVGKQKSDSTISVEADIEKNQQIIRKEKILSINQQQQKPKELAKNKMMIIKEEDKVLKTSKQFQPNIVSYNGSSRSSRGKCMKIIFNKNDDWEYVYEEVDIGCDRTKSPSEQQQQEKLKNFVQMYFEKVCYYNYCS